MDGNVSTNQMINNLKGKILNIPKIDKTLTRSGFAADAEVTGEELSKRFTTDDIVDNLNSDETDKPLSAKQGKVLKDKVDVVDVESLKKRDITVIGTTAVINLD